MRRLLLAVLFAGITAAIPVPKVAAPPPATVIETPAPATPLDAALILRATFRYAPKSIAFLDPLSGREGQNLLDSKRAEAKIPVTFATATVKNAAPPSGDAAQRITLDRLMVRTERSERGEVALDLDGLFRDRILVVERAGGGGAAQMFPLPPRAAPVWKWFGVLLAASLPWWPLGRVNRVLAALGVGCGWGLLALAIQQESGAVLPWIFSPLLPVLAAIPPGLNKFEKRKLPPEDDGAGSV